ncbi:MAG: thioredoxin-disulfide reductase [Candidatus Nitrosopumilus limneticus]|nr:thioredoxin-disulfide reductase [Candidatus Nitrosopumilus limneticus]MDC4213423.1 thioredoxin-disulfide reductase [Candidatus Nitrosopumilus limneticus]MDC4214301.1 thioredoxin-disulfide reductase [Candidatus Nitrosopumilus limneticus]MDC4215456.1 thioredoxin-disulfide reductase [Candidatus Nitrosopumilus limneticus]MDC4216689.1 thioredoxin-disulfide reductase [Candidatus Nitrosopumilus limneticus]
MMSADAGAAVLKSNNDGPKIPDKKKTKFDVIIIGAGPSGYTAGIYCSRAGYDTLILSGLLPGGQLVNTTEVENYPGFENGIMGPDLMIDMRKQSQRMGTTIIDDVAVDIDFRNAPYKVLTGSEEYEGRAVIIATGANPKKMDIKGEKEFSGKGVSYCATCDGPFFRNLELIVVGGGDSAIEEATFLTKFATRVHLVHRREELRASKVMQKRAMNNEKIQFHWNSEVIEIKGDQKMQQAVLKNLKTNEEKIINVGGLFVAIGHIPNTQLFEKQINLDDEGYIILKNKTHTNIEGIFAAGDVHDRSYRQAITAAGFGCMAAIDVDKFLTENADK